MGMSKDEECRVAGVFYVLVRLNAKGNKVTLKGYILMAMAKSGSEAGSTTL